MMVGDVGPDIGKWSGAKGLKSATRRLRLGSRLRFQFDCRPLTLIRVDPHSSIPL